ncbi:MAG TPA: hypothetical protein VGD43_10115, partial [Micromonospora sp.]
GGTGSGPDSVGTPSLPAGSRDVTCGDGDGEPVGRGVGDGSLEAVGEGSPVGDGCGVTVGRGGTVGTWVGPGHGSGPSVGRGGAGGRVVDCGFGPGLGRCTDFGFGVVVPATLRQLVGINGSPTRPTGGSSSGSAVGGNGTTTTGGPDGGAMNGAALSARALPPTDRDAALRAAAIGMEAVPASNNTVNR